MQLYDFGLYLAPPHALTLNPLHTTSFRVMKEIFQVFTTILDVILLLLFLVAIFAIFGKYVAMTSKSITLYITVTVNVILYLA